jgi:nucleotide-binding universal stress UspA family protein
MAIGGNVIIAGYDGSSGSVEALDWAVLEARLRGTPVTVCHAWTSAVAAIVTAGGAEPVALDLAREQADRILADGMRHVRASAASDEVRPLLACGSAAQVLCEQSSSAGVIVVGARGAGGMTGLQLGSVGLQVAAHAQAPVTVVRGSWRPVPKRSPVPVVVGADGSAASLGALDFAMREAELRGVPLVAVCALSDSAGVLGVARRIDADFCAAVDRVLSARPGVEVERRVEQGPPRAALLTAASGGQLLVMGARGRGGLREMMLGSVSLAMLHHATCPVTIVRPS